MSKLRAAVIGVGNMGRHHARIYSELSDIELVAVADPSNSSVELATKYSATHYDEYKDMLEKEKIDLVSVAIPTKFHLEAATETLKRGIPTLIEKPIASSIAEANELINLSQQYKTILTVGHVERYNPVVRKLRQMIKDDKLGQISSVISTRLGGLPNNEPDADVVVDLAVHDIDIISYVLGMHPELLEAHGSRTHYTRRTDSAEILLRFGKASGFIQANWVTPAKVRQISITGSKGYAVANYITQEIVYYEKTAVDQQEDFLQFVKKFGEPRVYVDKNELEEPLKNELLAFCDTVRGKRENALVDPEDAKIALSFAIKVSKHIDQGAK